MSGVSLLWAGAILGALMLVAAVARFARRRFASRHTRMLKRFASDNELRYRVSSSFRSSRRGILQPQGAPRVTVDRFTPRGGGAEWFEVGTVQADGRFTLSTCTYVTFWLRRKVPHLYLRNLTASGPLNAAPYVSGLHRLTLEGDFHLFFTVYCEAGYERDALYILTPDLMAALVDNASNSDVEFIEDQFFVYFASSADITTVSMWTSVCALLNNVRPRAVRRSAHYVDTGHSPKE